MQAQHTSAWPARCRCALAALAPVLCALPAAPQLIDRPESSRRTVALYTFEEPNNPFEVPADFFRAQSDPDQGISRPGYPVFNMPAFSTEHARSGRTSVVLPIERGSVCLRLRPGALPIFADADYRIACHVRAEQIQHARFRLVGRLLDQNAAPIPNAEFMSEPVLPGENWTEVAVEIPGGLSDAAAFLQIDAELVQPEQYREPTLGDHQVWPEDFQGNAWIDDIAVTQLPRIWVRTDAPGGIIARPDEPKLRFLVRDLTGENLVARLTLTDINGRTIFADQRPVRSSANSQPWPVELPRLGWYHATLDILVADRVVGSAECSIAHVDASNARTDAQGGLTQQEHARFEFAVDNWERRILAALPHLGRAAATSGLAIGGWDESATPDNIAERTDQLLTLLGSSEHQWVDPAVTLHHVPRALQENLVIDVGDITSALTEDREVWRTYLDPMLDRLGQLATRWRIGPSRPGPGFIETDGIANIRREFGTLVPGPRIGVVQRPHLAFPDNPDDPIDEITLAVNPGTGVRLVPDAVERFTESPIAQRTRLTIAYRAHDTGQFDAETLAGELVKRIILGEFAAGDTGRITHQILEAWTVSGRDGIISPEPALPAWRATIDRLDGRTVAAELAVIPGIRAYLLVPDDPEDPRGGALVAWNESASDQDAWVRTNLGAGKVTRVDIWGNHLGPVQATSLESPGGQPVRLHELPVSRLPIFVEGIDVEIAMFVASIRLDEPRIQTTPGPHRRNFVITNPWPVAIDGDVIILEPAERLDNGRSTGWDISPRVSRFSIGPGETTRVPIDLSFAAVELAGVRPFIVDVAVRSGPIQERLRAPSIMELTLDGIELDARSVVSREGNDIALEAIVTNIAAEPMDLILSTAARGYPRQSATITQLAPGASTVRRFIFPGGAQRLTGFDLYLGVEDPVRRGRFNRRIPVE